METVTGRDYAIQAQSDKYDNVPYSSLDCQGFVEKVLKDCKVTKPDGTYYNWKGSNSMWRNALAWKGTIEECKLIYDCIPLGAWVFIVKNDGGEQERGYFDDQGNAVHVGIYCNDSNLPVRDSTKNNKRNGVGYRSLKGFTHVGLPLMIRFKDDISASDALRSVSILRDISSSDIDFLKALTTLTEYIMRGDA